ncbi:hypothetical protein TL16_g07203 [Triparma laevis f. inornata]|uniref:Palmitoyltransferase n=1 Tax=Triparma laevis f. inornata TaxID=1714386 RepID=A0A9W7EFD8_9STRA|nr:hypothetical protein TL16_g07203 [Triparma laevis f. inornata]
MSFAQRQWLNLQRFLDNNDIDVFFVFQRILVLVIDYGMWILGPILICFACSIIAGLVWVDYTLILPLICKEDQTVKYTIHVGIAAFLVVNILFNYCLCVITKHKGENYDRVVRELAEVTDYEYPENEEQNQQKKKEFERRMLERHKRRQENRARREDREPEPNPADSETINNETSEPETPPPPSWLPPRSHYDHVSKALVLNMDHFCPWMANCVGYFNYRYFLNFLIYVWVAMVYAICISFNLFRQASKRRRRGAGHLRGSKGVRGGEGEGEHTVEVVTVDSTGEILMTRDQRSQISFAFMLCCSVGVAVFFLMAFHIYLACSAQTTIEFHGNMERKRKARYRGVLWSNPYDLGWRRNLLQVYGSLSLWALLPSTREPNYLPLPIPGTRGKRKLRSKKEEGEGREGGLDVELGGLGGGDGGGGGGSGGEEETTPLVSRRVQIIQV